MHELKSVYLLQNQVQEVNFGYIRLKLKTYLDERGITRNQLAVKSGIKYQTIDKYYKSKTVERLDLVLLAKICYVLDCKVCDLLEYSCNDEIVPEATSIG